MKNMDSSVSENGQIQGVAARDTVAVRSNIIINNDCLTALKDLPDKSVDCCVTSPPYYNTGTVCGKACGGFCAALPGAFRQRYSVAEYFRLVLWNREQRGVS